MVSLEKIPLTIIRCWHFVEATRGEGSYSDVNSTEHLVRSKTKPHTHCVG